MKQYLEQFLNQYIKPAVLPVAALAGGVLTMLMRMWVFGLGTDDRGLLVAGSFPDAFSWILTALTVVFLILGVRDLTEATKYSFNFPASTRAACGTALGALGIFITCFVELLSGAARLGVFSAVVGLLAAAALAFVAFCRKGGMKPSFIFHSLVCVWLMLHLISHYRLWSAYPQLQTYGFELMAIVFLMLSCYQRAAFDAGHGDRRAYMFFTLAALFFCVAAIPGSSGGAFYIGSAAWMLTTPCNLKPLRTKPEKYER